MPLIIASNSRPRRPVPVGGAVACSVMARTLFARMGPMGNDGFRGWPADALAFYDELATDNSKTWWHANKARYEAVVRGPMLAFADEVRDEFGPMHVFRPF